MKTKNKGRYIIIAIFIFIFLLRLYKITNPPLDYSSWRQCDTDSIARNFVEYRFNIFYPQLNYDGPMPNYVQLELQITTFIIALLYRLLGYSPVIGRIVPVLFFMGSCYYLYLCVKKRSGRKIAALSVLFYGILPINVVYSRNIMPESALMFFTLGGIYYFLRWIDGEKLSFYLLSLVFTTLAVATKVPAAFIGMPLIYLAVKKYKTGVYKELYLYIFPLVALGLPYIYYSWLGTLSEQGFVNGISSTMILPNFLTSIFKRDVLSYISVQFTDKIFTISGIILFFIGLVIKKNENEYYYYAWLLAAVFHVIFIDAVIHLDYYMIFITPIISIFMAFAAYRMFIRRKYRYFAYIAAVAMLINSLIFIDLVYDVQEQYMTIGNHVMSVTQKGDLIIIDKDSPELLYTSNRKGWRLYGDTLTEENIKKLANEGAKYFVPASLKLDSEINTYLDETYEKISFDDGYYIYRLR